MKLKRFEMYVNKSGLLCTDVEFDVPGDYVRITIQKYENDNKYSVNVTGFSEYVEVGRLRSNTEVTELLNKLMDSTKVKADVNLLSEGHGIITAHKYNDERDIEDCKKKIIEVMDSKIKDNKIVDDLIGQYESEMDIRTHYVTVYKEIIKLISNTIGCKS